MCERRIHERAESETAAAPPPEQAPPPVGHRGDPGIHPCPANAPCLFPQSQCCLPLSSRSPPSLPSPPFPGSLRPSALCLLPLGAVGRAGGGALGRQAMPLPLLDIGTSTVSGEEQEEGKKEKGKGDVFHRRGRTKINTKRKPEKNRR